MDQARTHNSHSVMSAWHPLGTHAVRTPMGRGSRVGVARYAAGFFLGLVMGGLAVHGLPAASAGGAFTNGSSGQAVVRPLVPPCGYTVEGRTLWVKSFGAKGRVRVYSNRTMGKVRDRAPIGFGESVTLPLKRSGHSELDLVAYVGRAECEPA